MSRLVGIINSPVQKRITRLEIGVTAAHSNNRSANQHIDREAFTFANMLKLLLASVVLAAYLNLVLLPRNASVSSGGERVRGK